MHHIRYPEKRGGKAAELGSALSVGDTKRRRTLPRCNKPVVYGRAGVRQTEAAAEAAHQRGAVTRGADDTCWAEPARAPWTAEECGEGRRENGWSKDQFASLVRAIQVKATEYSNVGSCIGRRVPVCAPQSRRNSCRNFSKEHTPMWGFELKNSTWLLSRSVQTSVVENARTARAFVDVSGACRLEAAAAVTAALPLSAIVDRNPPGRGWEPRRPRALHSDEMNVRRPGCRASAGWGTVLARFGAEVSSPLSCVILSLRAQASAWRPQMESTRLRSSTPFFHLRFGYPLSQERLACEG